MILYVGEPRKDGKIPVTFVFPTSGKRLNKLLTREQFDAELPKADEIRRRA